MPFLSFFLSFLLACLLFFYSRTSIVLSALLLHLHVSILLSFNSVLTTRFFAMLHSPVDHHSVGFINAMALLALLTVFVLAVLSGAEVGEKGLGLSATMATAA